ncbi:methylenetetrahydrofolate--tRNA-(uracil(54)-C(5))-methyltransferase (FADH(2)-oxidizing) TrmFO [Candidatus Cloacimonadota bacterium]
MSELKSIKIIGGGLAGSEAALQLADSGWQVDLYEMRPEVKTPAHESGDLSELVCSNSFKSKLLTTASGLLKEEMKLLGCKLLPLAEKFSVPAGNALAINRSEFAKEVTKTIEQHPGIRVHRGEVSKLEDELTIVATGPLTSEDLTEDLLKLAGEEHLYFFDAIAPIVEAHSLDLEVVFRKTRYDKGEADYLNCPLNRDQYYEFVEALNSAAKHEAREFESRFFQEIDFSFYENCTPIEELARRGKDTLRFGVMRPVGLEDPNTGRRPYAVIQLRAENKAQTSFNLVGCQTMLKYGEQKRIFRMIPGLEKAEFHRYGSIHRNTYLNSPHILNKDLSLCANNKIFIAGQLSGVEGYVESILAGMLAARNLNEQHKNNSKISEIDLPETTISGQLWRHLVTEVKDFQPMNANFGLLPALSEEIRDKKKKKAMLAERALEDLKKLIK